MTSMSRQNRRRRLGVTVLVGLAIGLGVLDIVGPTDLAARSQPIPLSYTVEQATEGRSAYLEQCAACHGENMDDGEFALPLKGVDFRRRWRSSSPEALFTLMRDTMPQDRPGLLDAETYAQLLAYILQENETEPGTAELPADPEALAMASPGWPRAGGGGLAPGAILPPTRTDSVRSTRSIERM